MLFEQNLIRSSSDLTATARNADAASLQILLHLQGHGATTKDIDGYRGTDTNDAAEAWAQQHMENTHSGSVDFTNSIPKDVLRAIALFNRQERFAKVMGIEGDTMLAKNATQKLMENADKAKEYLQEKLAADTSGTLTLGKKISAMALAVQILLRKAGNNPQGLDGHVGGKTLAAAKAFAKKYDGDSSTAEEDKIDWNGGWPIPNAVLRKLVGEESSHSDADTGADEAEFPNAPANLIPFILDAKPEDTKAFDITFDGNKNLKTLYLHLGTEEEKALFLELVRTDINFTNTFTTDGSVPDIDFFSWSQERGFYIIHVSESDELSSINLEEITGTLYFSDGELPNNFSAPKLTRLDAWNLTSLPNNFSAPNLTHLDAWNLTSLPNKFSAPNLTRLDALSLTSLPNNFSAPNLTHLDAWSLKTPLKFRDFPALTHVGGNEIIGMYVDDIRIDANNRDNYEYVNRRVQLISQEEGEGSVAQDTTSDATLTSTFTPEQQETIANIENNPAAALTAAQTELGKSNANKSWVEALLNAIFGMSGNRMLSDASVAAAEMLEDQVRSTDEDNEYALSAESNNNLGQYHLAQYQANNESNPNQAATHASSALRYANQTLELTAAEDNSIAQDEVNRLETSARNILAQLSSVPHFGPGEVQNMFDTVTTLDVDLDDAHTNGAGIPEDYIDGSDVKYEELQEALIGRFGLDSGEIESTIFNAELEERTLEVMKRIATPAFQQIFSQYAVDGNRGTAWEKVRLLAGRKPGASASTMTSDEETNIATSIDSMDKEDVLALVEATKVMEGIRNLAKIEEASRNIALRELIDEHLGHVLDALPSALAHPSALDAENASGFNDLALFFAEKEILDPHQSARELFLLLADYRADVPRDREDMLVADTGNIFKKALEAFTNQNPAAAAALMKAESYEDLFGAPPTEDAVTPAEPRQPEEIGGSPADHQKYINKARGHALQQLRLTRNVVDDFVTGMFDGVPGDVNDKAEDAFTAMIARLEDTENHPNYVLDIPFGASIDAVAKPEDPQNAAILENWEQEKHILGIRVSSEVDTNQFGSKLMGAIHGTQNSTDWDFGVNNISGTNEYLISVKTDGKLRTALQESGANPATWELALREILRAGMQHTQIEGEFFNPRTAHRRGMEAFEQQEKNEEMEQLRISERFLRNHEARASSLEINGETISTFAIERQVGEETYYVHVADVSGAAIEAMPSGLGTARVFVTKGSGENAELLHERGEIEKVLSLNANNDEVFPEEAQKLYRFNETRPAGVQYNADHLRVDGEIIPTASYAYLGYVLHIAKRNRNNNYEEGFTPPSNFASRDADTDADYEVFLTKKGDNANVQTETLPLITDALLIERATRAVEQHLSGEAEAEEERTADFLDLFHHHFSHYEEAKEPDPTDGTATEFQHAIFEEINTSFAEIDGTDYFVLDLSHENTPTDVRVHLEGAFRTREKLYIPLTDIADSTGSLVRQDIPPVVVVTEDLPGGYKHEFLAIGTGKRPYPLVETTEAELHAKPNTVGTFKHNHTSAPLVRHVHIAGQTAPDRVEASSAE